MLLFSILWGMLLSLLFSADDSIWVKTLTHTTLGALDLSGVPQPLPFPELLSAKSPETGSEAPHSRKDVQEIEAGRIRGQLRWRCGGREAT